MDDLIWDVTAFSNNRDLLLEEDVAGASYWRSSVKGLWRLTDARGRMYHADEDEFGPMRQAERRPGG